MRIFVGRLLPTPSHTRTFTPLKARSGGPSHPAAGWVPRDSDKETEEARSHRDILPDKRVQPAPPSLAGHNRDGLDRPAVDASPRLPPVSAVVPVPAPPGLPSASADASPQAAPSALAAPLASVVPLASVAP
jgi:hypothetical protein